jgi:hypothetical protein
MRADPCGRAKSSWGISCWGSVFCAFFLWQFPYDRLKNVWIQNLEGSLPLTLSIDRVSPVFPGASKLENIRVAPTPSPSGFPTPVFVPISGAYPRKPAFDLADTGNPSRVAGQFRQEKTGTVEPCG